MVLSQNSKLDRRARIFVAAAWVLVTVAAIFAYWPGLSGPFLLDDFGSVAPLGDYGGVRDWYSFKAFVFGGHAGPTGRPVSLLSFLIDANNWPADAWPFKRTNLVIHLMNGVLLGVLTTLVLGFLEFRRSDIRWIAFVSAALWLLHPFLVSTTLYVVQRMAQLATMFMFSGLIAYLYGRSLIAVSQMKGYLVMSAGIGVFTLLAMLSKENGILLPVLIGVVELTVVASQRHRIPALNRLWGGLFIALPSLVIALYLGARTLQPGFFEIAPPRDFSLYERVLTQGRVLIEYLQHWFLPKLYTTGVFQDHYIKSTGLFSPVTTVLSYLVHVALIAFALVKRRQLPLYSLAVLFFYASHLLESTVINLELYFEHRNYVAVAFLFLPFVEISYRKLSGRAFGLAALFVIVFLTSFTRYSATVWQSLPSMLEASALKAPNSARAQSQYAKLLFYLDRNEEALAVIDKAIVNTSDDDPLLLMVRLYFLCGDDALDDQEFELATKKIALLPFDSRALKAYNVFADQVVKGSCPNITPDSLERMFLKMLDLPANSDPSSLRYAHVNFLIGYSRTFAGRPQEALAAFERSLSSRPGPSHAMAMASLMASKGFGKEALVLSDKALTQLAKEGAQNPRRVQTVKESDIREFQETVKGDFAGEQGADISDEAD